MDQNLLLLSAFIANDRVEDVYRVEQVQVNRN